MCIRDRIKTERLREILLSLHGVGPETADSILLYALERPVFVVDAYTRRMLSRLFNDESYSTMSYDAVATLFHECVPPELTLYNEYHALIVRLCKEYCIKRAPRCTQCPLADLCACRFDNEVLHRVKSSKSQLRREPFEGTHRKVVVISLSDSELRCEIS